MTVEQLKKLWIQNRNDRSMTVKIDLLLLKEIGEEKLQEFWNENPIPKPTQVPQKKLHFTPSNSSWIVSFIPEENSDSGLSWRIGLLRKGRESDNYCFCPSIQQNVDLSVEVLQEIIEKLKELNF